MDFLFAFVVFMFYIIYTLKIKKCTDCLFCILFPKSVVGASAKILFIYLFLGGKGWGFHYVGEGGVLLIFVRYT